MSIFRAYDIRGIYGKDLTDEIMTRARAPIAKTSKVKAKAIFLIILVEDQKEEKSYASERALHLQIALQSRFLSMTSYALFVCLSPSEREIV